MLKFLANGVYGEERDDRHVKICGGCVPAAIGIITSLLLEDPEKGVRLEKDLRCVHRSFWIDLMHLVTRVRDTAEVDALGATMLATCGRCTSHAVTTGPPQADFVGAWMANVVYLVLKCASLGRASIWNAKFSTRGHWPTGIDDLLPHGPDLSMRGLLFWLLRGDEVSFYTLVLRLLVLAPTQTATEVLRQRQVVMSTLYTRFVTNLCYLQHSDIPSRANIMARLDATSRIFLMIDQLPSDNVLEHIYYREKMTFAVIDNFYHIDDREFRSALLRRLAQFLQSLVLITRVGQAAWDSIVRTFPPEFRLDDSDQPPDPYIVFRDIVLKTVVRTQCDATGCNRYGEVEGIKLRKCARCRVVFYCSRECQAAHWRATIHPHKELCTILQKVHQAADDGLPDPQYSAACLAAGISVDELANATRLWMCMTGKRVPDELEEEVEQIDIRCASRPLSQALLTNVQVTSSC